MSQNIQTQQNSAHEWLTDREVAEWLRVSRVALQQHRARGTGPPFARIGRSVRYQRVAVVAWLAEQTVVAS